MKMTILAILTALILSACGRDPDKGKSLFSVWAKTDKTGTLDLSSASTGTSYVYFFLADGTKCIAQVTITGTDADGTDSVFSSISSPYDSAKDPGCQALIGTYSHKIANNILTFCRLQDGKPTGCATYN